MVHLLSQLIKRETCLKTDLIPIGSHMVGCVSDEAAEGIVGRIGKSETTFLAFFLPFSVCGLTNSSLLVVQRHLGGREVRVCGRERGESRESKELWVDGRSMGMRVDVSDRTGEVRVSGWREVELLR